MAFRAADPDEDRAPDGRGQTPLELTIHAESGGEEDKNLSQAEVTITQTDLATLRQEYEDVGYNDCVEVNGTEYCGTPREMMPELFNSTPGKIDYASSRFRNEFPPDPIPYDLYSTNLSAVIQVQMAGKKGKQREVTGDGINCTGSNIPFELCMDQASDLDFWIVNSNYRSPAYNRDIPDPGQGNPLSTHLDGQALDFDWESAPDDQGNTTVWHPYDLLYSHLNSTTADRPVLEALKRWIDQEIDPEEMYPEPEDNPDHLHIQWVPKARERF